jgi:hypothetical protein
MVLLSSPSLIEMEVRAGPGDFPRAQKTRCTNSILANSAGMLFSPLICGDSFLAH